MTTLAESFLADLDDLSDASDHEQTGEPEEEDAEQVRRLPWPSPMVLISTAAEPLSVQMVLDDVENLNYDSLEAVAHLRASERYKEIMQVTAPPCIQAQLKYIAMQACAAQTLACQQWHCTVVTDNHCVITKTSMFTEGDGCPSRKGRGRQSLDSPL